MTIDPRRVAEIFRDREHPDWHEAYEYVLHEIFVKLLSKLRSWPRVSALGEKYEDVDTVAQQMTGEFWLFLNARPKVLEYAKIRGPGALWVQARHFLSEYPPDMPPELAEVRLRKHLFDKVLGVLRSHDFLNLTPSDENDTHKRQSPLWGLDGFPPTSATEEDLVRAEAEQGDLPAKWEPQRGGDVDQPERGRQTPPIATARDLTHHLRHVLSIAGRYCQVVDLRDLCWKALRPANPYRTATDFEQAGIHGIPDRDWQDAYRDPFIVGLLHRHMTSLSSDDRRILKLTLGRLGVRDIERETSLPHSTISRKLEKLRKGLSDLLRENGYQRVDEADKRLLDRVLWDILDS